MENRQELIALLSENISHPHDDETWVNVLTEAEVPCAPVQTIDQVFTAPQVLHRDMLVRSRSSDRGQGVAWLASR